MQIVPCSYENTLVDSHEKYGQMKHVKSCGCWHSWVNVSMESGFELCVVDGECKDSIVGLLRKQQGISLL